MECRILTTAGTSGLAMFGRLWRRHPALSNPYVSVCRFSRSFHHLDLPHIHQAGALPAVVVFNHTAVSSTLRRLRSMEHKPVPVRPKIATMDPF